MPIGGGPTSTQGAIRNRNRPFNYSKPIPANRKTSNWRIVVDLSASNQLGALHYMFNLVPFSLIGPGGYVAPCTVVVPAGLFEELELEPMREENPAAAHRAATAGVVAGAESVIHGFEHRDSAVPLF
jgi:hypothetical protein